MALYYLLEKPNDAERRVTISGTQQAVDKARDVIQNIINEAAAAGRTGGTGKRAAVQNANLRQILVHADKVGLIIGRGGETVKSFQDQSGAKINIMPNAGPHARPYERLIEISGTEPAINRAHKLIDDTIINDPRAVCENNRTINDSKCVIY